MNSHLQAGRAVIIHDGPASLFTASRNKKPSAPSSDVGGEGSPKTVPLPGLDFCLYATGNHTLESVDMKLKEVGLTGTRDGLPDTRAIELILKNTFYYGVFKYKGEFYEGSHPPIISKSLFNKVAAVFASRNKPHNPKKPNPLIKRCASPVVSERSESNYGADEIFLRLPRFGSVAQDASARPFNQTLRKPSGERAQRVELRGRRDLNSRSSP